MVRAIIIVCVIIAILDYLLLFAIYEGDNKNGLFVFTPARNLHCRCDNRKVEHEDMNIAEAIQAISDYCYNSSCNKCDYSFDSGRCMFMEVFPNYWEPREVKPISEDIQHVGYSQEACGYEK